MAKKGTKKALIASVLSMTLSASMFVGTTFAWFTDSVESGVNTIVAGNLDVELTHSGAGDDGAFSPVKGATNLFKNKDGDPMLWEPNASSTEIFQVTNEGTLALKYRFAINYDNATKTSEGKTLADVLTATITTPEGTTTSTLKDFSYSANLYATQMHEFTVTIAWPQSANDNAFNVKGGLSIDLGVSVFATQLTFEEDGEDDQYDLAAPWTGAIPASLDKTTLDIVPGGGTQTGTITINSTEDFAYLNKLAAEWVSIYSNGQGTNVGSYRPSEGGKGTDYYYYWTWDVYLAADLDMSNIPMNSVSTAWGAFHGNGHTISNVVMKDGERALFQNGLKVSDLTVKNIVVDAPEGTGVGAIVGNTGDFENVHVENANIIGGKYVGALAGKGANFKNCSVKNATVFGNDKTAGGFVGYACGDPNQATVSGNTIEEVTVTGAYNVGGLLGQAQNVIVENNTVKNVTVRSTAELPANASANEVRTAELAARHVFDGTTIGTNTATNVTMINVAIASNTTDLQAAINSGAPEIALQKGDFAIDVYSVPANKNLTITGQGADTKIAFSNLQANLALFDSLTISNCTIERMPNKKWGHLVFGSSSTAGGVYTISNCTFNGVGSQGIYINQFVPATFNIENCTFNGDFGSEGAITIQNNDNVDITVNVTGCTFNNIPATSHEIFVHYAYSGWTLNAEGVTAFWKANA